MRRILAEPLCQFFLIAAVLVLSHRLLGPTEDSRPVLHVDADSVAIASADWAQEHGRSPDPAEAAAIITRLEEEALLLAESRARHLDHHDPVVRSRLIDLAVLALAGDAPEPEEATLRAWYEADPKRWQGEERLVLEQVALGETAAESLRSELEAGGDPYGLATAGELPITLGPVTRQELAQRLGRSFAAAVWALPEQTWSGPIASAADRHLVRVTQRFAASRPTFEELRYILAEAWQREAFQRRREQAIAELRTRYQVDVETGP